jgi:hypothetical protein
MKNNRITELIFFFSCLFGILLSINVLLSAMDTVYQIKIPEDLREFIPSKIQPIFEDLNQDGLSDIIFIKDEFIFISYQNKDGSFSDFEKIKIPISGALDFADVLSNGEKQLIVMHDKGISCFERNEGKWNLDPKTLVVSPTIVENNLPHILVPAHFAIDLDGDHIPELLAFSNKGIKIYKRNSQGSFYLHQELPIEYKEDLEPPGLRIYDNPIEPIIRGEPGTFYNRGWPIYFKYLDWTKNIVGENVLIADINHDSRCEFIRVKLKDIEEPNKGPVRIYEYQIHLMDEDGKFSIIPSKIIQDRYGVWLSDLCCDITGQGRRDLLRFQVTTEGNLFQKPKFRLELILQQENGDYPINPSQVIETSDYPLLPNPLIDIDGDGKKELVLIHPLVQGFSLGSIIRKYIERGIDIEIRVFNYRDRFGFVQDGLITKRLNVNFFWGFPINLIGDYNGDGAKDILLAEQDRVQIYLFDKNKRKFADNPYRKIKVSNATFYEVIDINGDNASEILYFTPEFFNIL